jgi:hypothetical protein
VVAGTSVVPVDANGYVELFVSATSHVVVDVSGFFDVATGGAVRAGRYVPIGPVAAIDTRQAPSLSNAYHRAIVGGVDVVNMPVRGLRGVPKDAAAVVLQVTGSSDSGPSGGVLVAMPHGGVVPPISNLNSNGNGDLRSNTVVVRIGADGSVDLRLRSMADVIVGVVGWFSGTTSASATGGRFVLVPPVRVVDSRTGAGFHRLAAGGIGSANPVAVPDTAIAITSTVDMVAAAGAGALTAFRNGLPAVPAVPCVRTTGAGQVRSGASFSGMGSGIVRYRSTVATDVLVDVTGYFAR